MNEEIDANKNLELAKQEVNSFFEGAEFGSAKHLALADTLHLEFIQGQVRASESHKDTMHEVLVTREALTWERITERISTIEGYQNARIESDRFTRHLVVQAQPGTFDGLGFLNAILTKIQGFETIV
jgi:hypothetical protein